MPGSPPPRPPDAGAGPPRRGGADLPAAVLDAAANFDDFDLQVLFEILQVAQSEPSCAARPYQAIFPAHEAVLDQRGLSRATADSPYLRFLYRLPPLRAAGQSLVDVFERALVRVGITIESASEGSGSGGDRTRLSEFSVQRAEKREVESRRDESEVLPWHAARRSSFSDFVGEEWRSVPRRRAVSRASVSRLQDHSQGFGAQMPDARQEERPSAASSESRGHVQEESKQKDTRREAQPAQPERRTKQQTGQKAGSSFRPQPLTPERAPKTRSTVRRTPERGDPPPIDTPAFGGGLSREALQRLELLWRSRELGVDAAQISSQNLSLRDRGTRQDTQRSALAHGLDDITESAGELEFEDLVQLPKPSPEQLEHDARTFDRFRMQDVARKFLHRWSEAAYKQRDAVQASYELATQLDQEALLRQAFRRWQLSCQLKQHIRDTERFHQSLEDRAARARNFRLVAKAFTHWAEHGAEERQRNEAARRHIIRLKYFHAWQEITAANQLKVRRFALAKFFGKWKGRLVRVLIQSHRADALHQQKVVQDAYWAWFWGFCGERAPQWRNGVLLRRYFTRWVTVAQERKDTGERVAAMRTESLLKKALERWRTKATQAKKQEGQAAVFQRAQTVSRALPQWRLQLRLAPAAHQTQSMVERRVVSHCFTTWAKRLAMTQQARRLDAFRIVRTAWVQWNDNMRTKVLQQQQAQRLVSSTLYKWVLAERGAHYKRVYEEHLAGRTLEKAASRSKEKRAQLQLAHDHVQALRKRNLEQSVLRAWRSERQHHASLAQQADAIHRPRTTTLALDRWCAAYNANLDLDHQADSAQDYFRTSRTLASWRAAAATSRKQKLQAAYAAVRVRHKKSQARSALRAWIARTNHTMALVDDAETQLHARLWTLARTTLASWTEALADARTAGATAATQRQAALLGGALRPWAERGAAAAQLDAQALAFRRSGDEKAAYECLRRLQLRVLDRQNLAATARTVHSWAHKRRARALLRRWAERAADGEGGAGHDRGNEAPRVPGMGVFSPGNFAFAAGARSFGGRGAGDERLEEWIASTAPAPGSQLAQSRRLLYDLDVVLNPLPAYLSTPSKRAARARMVTGTPSFTPRTEPRKVPRDSDGEGMARSIGAFGFR